MKRWEVHLATPKVTGELVVRLVAYTEHGALATALKLYPSCYVLYTRELVS